MNNRVLTLGLAFALLVLGATVSTGVPSANAEESEISTDADPMQFARGAQTWANNCARCHNMRDPKELRDDQWQAAVAHMRVRAGLTGQEARDILKFLQESN
tara:strand:- start:744 stop:1049 length:306 start_codon:yes stop_codon:yes gene_type:complete